MKSKLIVGTCLLAVWVSACGDGQNPVNGLGDGGIGDAGTTSSGENTSNATTSDVSEQTSTGTASSESNSGVSTLTSGSDTGSDSASEVTSPTDGGSSSGTLVTEDGGSSGSSSDTNSTSTSDGASTNASSGATDTAVITDGSSTNTTAQESDAGSSSGRLTDGGIATSDRDSSGDAGTSDVVTSDVDASDDTDTSDGDSSDVSITSDAAGTTDATDAGGSPASLDGGNTQESEGSIDATSSDDSGDAAPGVTTDGSSTNDTTSTDDEPSDVSDVIISDGGVEDASDSGGADGGEHDASIEGGAADGGVGAVDSGADDADSSDDELSESSSNTDVDSGINSGFDSGAGSPDSSTTDDTQTSGASTDITESTDESTASTGESSDGTQVSTDDSDTSAVDAGAPDSGVVLSGQQLFEEAEFGGNGRTCLTCHTAASGTISPQEIQTLFSADPSDPMFRPIDSNDGVGTDYSILLDRATFRVEIPLPPGVTLVSDPSATSVVLRRSVPTTLNTPALDPTLMWDGRATDLLDQAMGAIMGHAEATVTPTEEQLALISAYEHTEAFFSSDLLRDYAEGGTAPQWPAGITAEEQRGRRWFAEDRVNAPRFNICGQCHGGPMANETQQNSGLPVGEHFQTANVSEFNTKGNPPLQFRFPNPNNASQTIVVTTPDPGLALTTGDVRDVNFFKIPTLWGINKTAPYFHDNSAATLEELMEHYEDHLATFLRRNRNWPTPHVPTAQDKADIIAYMKLL